MRIESLILRDVGPFKDARIDFPPGRNPDLADVYLLTGPNGSGKSTVLYAIAAAVGGGIVGNDHLWPRFHPQGGLAVVDCGERQYGVIHTSEHRVESPFGGFLKRQQTRGDAVGYYTSTPTEPAIHHYSIRASSFRPGLVPPVVQFDWAAFAYAGTRSTAHVEVPAIREPVHSPFEQSLSFDATADANHLAHWVANQWFKRLKAKDVGDHVRATQIERSLIDIQRVVGNIVDDPGFEFVARVDDNNPRIRYLGQVVDLGVLPDGLKSIVAWVADLLMRLDRIPWAGDIPPLERTFLLLLDEIDIHLHPAWQRKVLPIVQRMFPRAQIIASTHSPFVVASADDACIIPMELRDGVAHVGSVLSSQIGRSYGAVLRSIFGIEFEFDVETERELDAMRDAKQRALAGEPNARGEVDRIASGLASRSEELKELVGFEVRQLDRQLAQLAQRRAP